MKSQHCLFRKLKLKFNIFLSVFIFLLIFSSYVFSDENEFNKNRFSNEWKSASNAELDALRGGFSLGNGVVINFSLEKRIFKNGVESLAFFFDFPKNIPLAQIGALNLPTGFTNTIINNDLDNQAIRVINTINIDLSNLKNLGVKSIKSLNSLILPIFYNR
jgi:hypothetical protein